MEFSFDRSRNSNLNSPRTQASVNSTGSDRDETDPSHVANERLRKAIERNRARQKEREQMAAQSETQATSHQTAWNQHQTHAGMTDPRQNKMETESAQSSVKENSKENQREISREARVEVKNDIKNDIKKEEHSQSSLFDQSQKYEVPPKATEREHVSSRVERVRRESPIMPSRKSVARPEETEFAPVKRTTKRAAPQIAYSATNKKKAKEFDPALVSYLVKGAWIFCGFLILRLIFANGGVTDFFSQQSILAQRITELQRLKAENMDLVREIERMQLDVSYQKKLVRDNLGFIAEDEFLILFPKE